MKKLITGIKSTGSSFHLGNLMGAILPFARHAVGNDAAVFIADLHTLTSVKDGDLLRRQTLEIAIEYFAIYGIDTPITIFRQSDIRDITKLMWILANVTPYSLMLRAHSFKSSEQKIQEMESALYRARVEYEEMLEVYKDGIYGSEGEKKSFDSIIMNQAALEKEVEDYKGELYGKLNMGVFNYPILMAADIIGYDCDGVPVGKDQIQHIEMTRDIVRAFNNTYGVEVFREPETLVDASVATLPGIDGRKMSKSYDNFIGVFDDEKTMKKSVMSIVTDSRGVDDVKDPEGCNVFALIKVFATADRIETIRAKYLSASSGYGYGHAKLELLDILQEYLRPYREARERLLQDTSFVEAKLAEGARVMNARLEEKMRIVREVVGIN